MAQAIKSLKRLEVLNICNHLHIIYSIACNQIESEGAIALSPALSELKSLKSLDISIYFYIKFLAYIA